MRFWLAAFFAFTLLVRIDVHAQTSSAVSTEISTDTVLRVVDEMPEPVGGKAAFGNYLSKTLTYPKLARKEKIQGRVFVEFIVEKDGSLTNARIVKGIGGGCDEEALKAINASSPWIPGKHEGTLTRVRMIIPITFTL